VTDAVIRAAPIPILMVRGVGGHAFERVLVPLDGSATSEAVIQHAITLDRADAASIHLLQVEEAAEDLRASVWGLAAHEPDDLAKRLDRADRYLHGLIARFQSEWPPATVSVEARGAHRAGEAIVAVATEREVDLIAMTTHGRGASRLFIGSVADKVLRGTECNVLLYKSR
jgi:nucleotide-binding universal stress UspA family protein